MDPSHPICWQRSLNCIKSKKLELYRSLKDIPHISEVVKNSEAFKRLPVSLLKELLSDNYDDEEGSESEENEEGWPTAKHKFDAVVFWLSGNECDDKDKEFISNRLDFDHFIGEELLTDVRISGLFSDKMIH